MKNIRGYFDVADNESLQRIDDETCFDLNLDAFFNCIDFTASSVGQQYLYNALRTIPVKNKFQEQESFLTVLDSDENLKKTIGKLLKKLDNTEAYFICSLIKRKHILFTKLKLFLFHILKFTPLVSVLLLIYFQSNVFLSALIIGFLANLVIHYYTKIKSFAHPGSIPQLFWLIKIASQLNKIDSIKDIEPDISEHIQKVTKLRKALSVFQLDVKLDSDGAAIVWFISEIYRIFFLIEPIGLNKAFSLVNENTRSLGRLFNYVGFIDFLLSIHSLRKEIPYYCIPVFSSGSRISATDLYHPLIPDCVSNSFEMTDNSFIIIGSNMSGKTTFIRTTGINLLAAQTIHTCFAKKLILSPQKIFSSISIHDSLLEGKSYYLAEILRIKKILFDTQEGANLILLDELLRGTNTVERIAGAKAIIAYMAKNPLNKILIATHDIELTSLSGANFTPVFFMEQITKDTLGFDYKINYQQSQQKNAIRILGLYGFPAEVVEEALYIANKK